MSGYAINRPAVRQVRSRYVVQAIQAHATYAARVTECLTRLLELAHDPRAAIRIVREELGSAPGSPSGFRA